MDPGLVSRILPAVKHPITGKLYIGNRGQSHEDILNKHSLREDPRLNWNKDYAGHTGFVDPSTKKFHSRHEMPLMAQQLDSPSLMSKVQRMRKYGTESQEEEDRETLKSRVVPAIIHPETGRLYKGRRGDSHYDIFWHKDHEDLLNAIRKVPTSDLYRDYIGFHDPVTKKFHKRGDINLDASDLMTKMQRFKKYGHENQEEDKTTKIKVTQDLLDRLHPAIIHPETGKVSVGRRGDVHADIIDRVSSHYAGKAEKEGKDPEEARNKVIDDYADSDEHHGYYDPQHKTYHTKYEFDSHFDSTDLMRKQQRFRKFGTESFTKISLSKEVRDRLVPAVQHPTTGKVYTGRRGETHEDIYHKVSSRSESDNLDKASSRILGAPKEGFYDIRTKQFYHRADVDIDSSDLMTKAQRIKKFGTESHVLAVEADGLSVTSGRIQVRDTSIEVYGTDGSYLIIRADKPISDIMNGASSYLTFTSRS